MKPQVKNHLDTLVHRYPVLQPTRPAIQAAYAAMAAAFENGGKLLCAGNGGSAADAEHIVGELMKGFNLKRPLDSQQKQALQQAGGARGAALADILQGALPAVSLVSSVALQTAFSNDVDGTSGFAQQVHSLARAGDVFLGISTSGNSENVILAAIAAKAKDATVVALTGENGGALKAYSDVCIGVPAAQVAEIQELHLPVYHALCAMLESHFFTV